MYDGTRKARYRCHACPRRGFEAGARVRVTVRAENRVEVGARAKAENGGLDRAGAPRFQLRKEESIRSSRRSRPGHASMPPSPLVTALAWA
jgi:hypothetical protein